jgi:hypothetical protein
MQVNRANKLLCNCLGSEQPSVYMRAEVPLAGANFLAVGMYKLFTEKIRGVGASVSGY